MSSNVSTVCEQSTAVKKRRLREPVSYIKKIRSKIPRRKRFQIPPILGGFDNCVDNEPEFSVTQVISSSSCVPDEISSSSNWIPVGSANLKKYRSNRRKKEAEELQGNEIRAGLRTSRQLERIPGEYSRRKTKSYCRNNVDEKLKEKENFNRVVELSETSCVESFSGVEAPVLSNVDQFSERKLKLKDRARRVAEKEDTIEGDAASSGIEISETSCIQPFPEEIIWKNCNSGENVSGKTSAKKARKSMENQVMNSFPKSTSESKVQNIYSSVHDFAANVTNNQVNKAGEVFFSEISKKYVESKLEVADSESTADQIPKEFEYDNSLACSEHFSFEDGSENFPIHDHEMTLSDLESDIFPRIPDSQSSEYTPSFLIESSTDFSERSPDSIPPSYFSFLLHFNKQFCKLSSSEDIKISGRKQEEYSEEFTLLRFEDESHEESYKRFRSRERSLVLQDYAEKYYSTTDYGDLVLQQRMVMVNWIVEEANERELQYETMFLGVSLMDRFLSHGFFKSKRKLQMLGIACLALATRIEENQPYNCIRRKTFRVGSNGYTRCEVVAMEWLVQEVLHFQCFLPTTYNFLWFYLKAARANAEVEKIARFLAVLSLLDHERLRYWPSTIAAGLVILAALAANQDASCQLVMETHVRTKSDDLSQCIKCLEWLVEYVC